MVLLLTVTLPLLSALICGLLCRTLSHKKAFLLSTTLVSISALCSGNIFYHTAFLHETLTMPLWEWFNVDGLLVNFALKADVLTAVMLVVVTVVSSLVHCYAIGYMHDDPHVPRFMAYLSLFTFFMLMLVTADNFVQLFLGWEGVGLCSYLLIGFWFHKHSANKAAMKAFLVNRVADIAFALGIACVFLHFNSVQFTEVFSKVTQLIGHKTELLGMQFATIDYIAILLFIGCMGKSAQIGLHVWLADAMEGPTPVSALIHAATMVTAGVFLVARCSPLFEHAVLAREIMVWVGGLTCIFAATIAITQFDIKRIIAYSTCSQLGYMFFACGVSAYSAGIFHLMTHAFFKALLFLGAGSVIHALANEQDIRNMGGVWKKIPYTYALMWIGSLALAGVYPFAGFFSKDIILESAYASGTLAGTSAYYLGICAAFLTAFYSWRLIIYTFHGSPRMDKEVVEHAHESPAVMLMPLIILAIGAIGAGWYGDHFLQMVAADNNFWQGSLVTLGDHNVLERAHHVPQWVKYLPLAVGALGILFAYILYILVPSVPSMLIRFFKPIHGLLFHKYFFDEIYDKIFVTPLRALGRFYWQWMDVKVIDGLGPNGIMKTMKFLSGKVRKLQSGYIYHYAFMVIVSVIVLLTSYVVAAVK